MALIVDRVPDAAALWSEYAHAIGAAALRDAYGPHWPRPPLHDEHVWTFRRSADLERVAWGSIVHDPAERVAWHSHGVWPAFQAQRLTREVSAWLTTWAFERLPIAGVCAKILETNPRYQAYFKRHQHDPAFAWRYAGSITMPWPGYDVYCYPRVRYERLMDQGDGAPRWEVIAPGPEAMPRAHEEDPGHAES